MPLSMEGKEGRRKYRGKEVERMEDKKYRLFYEKKKGKKSKSRRQCKVLKHMHDPLV